MINMIFIAQSGTVDWAPTLVDGGLPPTRLSRRSSSFGGSKGHTSCLSPGKYLLREGCLILQCVSEKVRNRLVPSRPKKGCSLIWVIIVRNFLIPASSSSQRTFAQVRFRRRLVGPVADARASPPAPPLASHARFTLLPTIAARAPSLPRVPLLTPVHLPVRAALWSTRLVYVPQDSHDKVNGAIQATLRQRGARRRGPDRQGPARAASLRGGSLLPGASLGRRHGPAPWWLHG